VRCAASGKPVKMAGVDIVIADVMGDIALVFIASWLLGMAARRLGQPAVIGQIIAGVLLGPSALGRLPGHPTSRLFPHAALPYLSVIAQVAIVLFMFTVGYELDRRSLRAQRRTAGAVALAALLVPMGLGSGAAVAFNSSFAALGAKTGTRSFILFMGVVVAITALPVLAAILRERNMAETVVGVTATTAAGLMDVAAWLVLAVALVGTGSSTRPWRESLLLICAFSALMLLGIRPVLHWWFGRRRAVLTEKLPVALVLALTSAWVTASLGLHPIFGGFLAGLTMPRAAEGPDVEVVRPMEEISGVLLPLFFAVAGLSVNIGALNGRAFALLGLILVIGGLGKLVPAYFAARIGGLRPRESASVAALVNTRGLTELIALNVGLTAGLIGQRLYSVLVIMAVLLTIATAPLLELVRRLPARAVKEPPGGGTRSSRQRTDAV
jgi:Kef-type K+ transport system membrane component KefB